MASSPLHARPTYVDLMDAALSRWQDRVAFRFEDRSITYAQARSQVNHYAAALSSQTNQGPVAVAALGSNRPELFFAMAGTLTAGGRYTPLHTLGSLSDHKFILEDAEISVLVFDDDFADRAAELAGFRPDLRLLSIGGSRNFPSLDDLTIRVPANPSRLPREVRESDLALLSYTGGTTGMPKGVVRPHRVLVANALLTASEWELPKPARFLCVTPISHATGLMILPVLLGGGTVILESKFDPERALRLIEAEHVNSTFVVPSMLYSLLENPTLDRVNLTGLETVLYGAAPIQPERLQEAIERIGPRFMQLYGQVEAPNTIALLRRDDHTPERLTSCGLPVAGLRVQLMGHDGSPVDIGEIGEICVRGPLVMDGYWKQPALTRETLRGGWLHTGDLARSDEEGFLTIVGRAKDVVVSGGFNVYPKEVEDALGQHPGVKHAAVIGIPHPRWGEAVHAVVVPQEGVDLSPAELKDLVRRLKGPVATPKSIEIVPNIPLTPLGKPDKEAIRGPFWKSVERQVH